MTGSWPKPAERRLDDLDPKPDLDNANVGKIPEKWKITGNVVGVPLFCAIRPEGDRRACTDGHPTDARDPAPEQDGNADI